jgi:class 3 adenylate cyclase
MAEAGEAFKIRYSLRLKLTLGLVAIIAIIFSGVNGYNAYSHLQSRRNDALQHGETVARLIAGVLTAQLGTYALNSPQVASSLNSFLTAAMEINARNEELAFALAVDTKGHILGGRARPRLTVFPGNKTFREENDVLAEVVRLDGNLGGSMRTKRITLKGADKQAVGKLLVGISLVSLERQTDIDLAINGAIFIGSLFILLLYTTITLRRLVVSPIGRVVEAMRAVQAGQLEHEVDLKRQDEIGLLANTYNFMVRGLRDRARLEDAFSRYVSRQVYDKFRAGEIQLSGENRTATILFSDIRAFTPLSEQLSPPELVAMLNEYFTEMVEIVFKYHGFLNKFIGDAIMAIYNVPLTQTQPELRAVRTAVEMLEALNRLNEKRQSRGQPPLRIGIGINTGPVVAGNIGHQKRLEYTVIGDTVNVASRIEGQTKVAGSPILISETTYQAVASVVDAERLEAVKIKGKQDAVVLYALKGIKAAALASGKLDTEISGSGTL